ncbi:MAG TPA: Gfo/Idh/MocA family oxidoreductase [Candidatus Limnocylindrales bacterium]|nr:Gfo/Idh/MocA family oxidoreductase [Candidatus Limnocylindrales bacterium]
MGDDRRRGGPELKRPLGIGIVGAGRFAAFCISAFEGLTEARVVAVMDVERARAEAIAPPGAAAYDGLEALLDDPAVDIVHVGTPPYLHGPMAQRAAERGKHVFVEKPLATTLDGARAALAAAERAGVRVSIDYVLRHHPLHRLAIELTRSGALGALQHFALENFASSESLPPDHWFWNPEMSGGIHVEHGVHFFDLCLALAEREPDAVSGSPQRRSDGRADRASALLRFGDAMTASFYHSFNRTGATERTEIRLAFGRGHATLSGWIPTRLDVEGRVRSEEVDILRTMFGQGFREITPSPGGRGGVAVAAVAERPDRQDEYRRAIRAGMANLVAAITRDEKLEVTAEDGLRSLDVALRASQDQ